MMANSSDWIAALQETPVPSEEAPQGWIGALLEQDAFVEGLPFARGMTDQVSAPSEAHPQTPASAPPAPPALDPTADAFARGEAAGRAAAEAENAAAWEIQRGLRLNFRNLDQAAMDSLASELAETVTALCSQAIADFMPNAEQMLARCHTAAARLGASAEGSALHLHPGDLALLDPGTLTNWRIVSDEGIERGALHFESADGSISDGPPEWRRAISSAIRG